jgi:hypothetical protein
MKLGSESRPDCDAERLAASAERAVASWASAVGVDTPNISERTANE